MARTIHGCLIFRCSPANQLVSFGRVGRGGEGGEGGREGGEAIKGRREGRRKGKRSD